MFRAVREERTEHTKLDSRIFTGSGLTWHQKVNFSTFDGKLELQCIRNGLQNLPYCPGFLQNTFIIYSSISHHQIFQNHFAKNKNLENHKSENMKIQKPRFTNRNPERLLKPWFHQIAPTKYRKRRIVQLSRLLLVNLEKSGFRQKLFFW